MFFIKAMILALILQYFKLKLIYYEYLFLII